MKIYTKSGDSGTTGLIGGARVGKDSPRVRAYGDVDELNAWLGLVRAESTHEPVTQSLVSIQKSLFVVGADLASPGKAMQMERITSKEVDFLERQIDAMTETLPALRNFILPGGSRIAASLHIARSVCRRAERSLVELSRLPKESVDSWLIIYLNRLSDFLFVLARLANQLDGVKDIPWRAE